MISRPNRREAEPQAEHVRCLHAMQEVMNEFGGRMRELSMSSHVLSAAIAFCVHKDVPPGESAYSFVSDERIAGLTNELKLPYTDQSAWNLHMIYDGIMELRYAKNMTI